MSRCPAPTARSSWVLGPSSHRAFLKALKPRLVRRLSCEFNPKMAANGKIILTPQGLFSIASLVRSKIKALCSLYFGRLAGYGTPFPSLGSARTPWPNWRSSVQLTMGLAQGPACGDAQDAIDGRGPAAQALHGGQQTFHLRLQRNMSFEERKSKGLVYRSSPLCSLCIFYGLGTQ